jgi:DNA invertase Pin-like site-specific DNA recombinase
MDVGYIRVSTEEQKTIRQEVLMKELAIEKLYIESISGKDRNRPQLKEMLDFVREGDTVIVESYSRFSRSTIDLLNLVAELKEKKVEFKSIKEKFDTTTPQGKLMLTMFAGLYEYERECMLQRQKEGIDIAKKEGKYKGRQLIKIDDNKFKEVYTQWKDEKITAVQAMAKLDIKPNTFYRRVKKYESNK